MASIPPERHEIPVEHTWDLESIFATVDEWEAAIEALDGQWAELSRYEGRLGEGPAALADFMEKSETMFRHLGKIHIYAALNYSVDTEDQAWAARNDQARGLFGRAMATIAFAEPEMMALGFDTLRHWLTKDERLTLYGHYLDQMEKRQAHIRSGEVEQVLGMLSDPFGTATATHSVLADADLRFEPAVGSDGEKLEVIQGTISGLEAHPDREVRRTAWQNYADGHLAFKNTMANALSVGIKRDVFLAQVRRYDSSLDAALFGIHIPTAVFHNLLETYRANLPTWHRYWAIRRRALGYEKLYPYDVKAPLSQNPPQVPYKTAINWIANGMQPLGEDYVATLKRGALEERWIDIYPNKGKRMGAFSTDVPDAYPFIMMSYTDDLFGLSTLAHELGHSLHSYLAWQTQKILPYQDYGIFVAEVASNFNQALVRDYLLKNNDDPEFQIAVIEEAMSNFHRYFFIMPTLARFELEIHERVERGQALNADALIELMADLFQEGYGDEVEVDRARVGSTWAQFHTHLYANFYVFQYATGISAAHSLAEGILAGRPNATENYLAFLKAGGSLYPLDALNLAGVDMLSAEPVETTFGILADYVDRLEGLIEER